MGKIKYILMMCLLMSATCTVVSAAVDMSQIVRMQSPSSEITIGQAFSEIERQTGYIFAVNNSSLNTAAKVSIPNKVMPLDDMLIAILTGTGHTYSVVGNHIVITPGQLPVKQKPAKAATTVNNQQSYQSGYSAPANYYPQASSQEYSYSYQAVPQPQQPRLEQPAQVVQTQPLQQQVYSADKEQEFIFSTSTKGGDKNDIPNIYMSPRGMDRPGFALKTNLLYWATGTINIGMEIGLGRKTSLNIFGSYNPWNLNGSDTNNKKMVHWVIQPELRYWFCERFNGHALGINPLYGMFNISERNLLNVFEDEFRYEGNFYGFGINYAYHWMLGKRMGLEVSVGAGCVWLNYDKYDCEKCGDLRATESKFYMGPTKAAVTLVFLIK